MRVSKPNLICVAALQLFSIFSFAQGGKMQGPPVMPRDLSPFQQIVNIHGDDGYYIKKDYGQISGSTIINGEVIWGNPYFFETWYDGILTTPDNRSYQYKLRYNTYQQLVSFANGTDSLDVNEPIKDFVLMIPVNDTILKTRFISADQFQKEKTNFFYEVIIDNRKGMLLKNSKKVLTRINDNALIEKGRRYFNTVATYYYYDKTTEKVSRIKPGGSNVPDVLKLSADEQRALSFEGTDFNKDDDVIRFFKSYFKI